MLNMVNNLSWVYIKPTFEKWVSYSDSSLFFIYKKQKPSFSMVFAIIFYQINELMQLLFGTLISRNDKSQIIQSPLSFY